MGRTLKTTGPVSVSQDAVSRALAAEEKAELTQSEHEAGGAPPSGTGLQYGRRFAQTQERYQMRREPPRIAPSKPPIGALPVTPEAFPTERWRELPEQAVRRLRAVIRAAEGLVQASGQLLALPKDAAELLLRRLHVLRAG